MSVRVPALQAAIMAAVATAACVKVDKFEYRDAGGGPGSDSGVLAPGEVRALMVGDHVEVELKDTYKMVFAGGGFHLPEQLVIGNTQVFSPAQTGNCVSEYGVGVTYTPAGAVTTGTSDGITGMTSPISIDLSGGVARVSIDWAGSFVGSCVGAPYGRSIFTFFPDGRITRMDAASIGTDVAAANCQACVADPSWTIETYYGFVASAVNGPQGVALPSVDGMSTSPGTATVCFSGPGDAFQLGMGWRYSPSRRMRRVSATSLALIGDMALPGITTGTGIIGEESTTMIIASGTGCAAVRTRVSGYVNDVQIDVTPGTQGGSGLGDDGLYGGETPQNSNGGIYVPTSPFTIRRHDLGAIPPFGVWLDLQNFPTITGVHLTDGGAITHTIQKFGGTPEYVVWFPDGLASGQEITVEAQP